MIYIYIGTVWAAGCLVVCLWHYAAVQPSRDWIPRMDPSDRRLRPKHPIVFIDMTAEHVDRYITEKQNENN